MRSKKLEFLRKRERLKSGARQGELVSQEDISQGSDNLSGHLDDRLELRQ